MLKRWRWKRNSQSFFIPNQSVSKIFNEWNPNVFLDTHTTKGSDHQYSITLVPPPSARFPKKMETFLEKNFLPSLYREMKKGQYELIPYVDYMYHDPKQGIARSIEVTVDYIEEFSSSHRPYNGHFYHSSVTTRSEVQKMKYYRGDLVIPVRQEKIKYLLEMFEPKAVNSFFRWNFFDNILDQREYFSSYDFEENALKYLEEHPGFKAEFFKSQGTGFHAYWKSSCSVSQDLQQFRVVRKIMKAISGRKDFQLIFRFQDNSFPRLSNFRL